MKNSSIGMTHELDTPGSPCQFVVTFFLILYIINILLAHWICMISTSRKFEFWNDNQPVGQEISLIHQF